MSEKSLPYLQTIQDRLNSDVFQSRVLSSDLLDQVVKFHQKTTNIPSTLLQNITMWPELIYWIEAVQHTDTLPTLSLERIEMEVTTSEFEASARAFDKRWHVGKEVIGSILYGAFGRGRSFHKRYPSAGALYPIIPILCVFSKAAMKGVEPGSFAFDARQPALLRLNAWSEDDLQDVRSFACVTEGDLPSNLAMGYAIDMRRAVTKYRHKGYRHALIEIGLMAQSFRETLREASVRLGTPLGERCWSAFADNALTSMCGLDVRLAPIGLLQWFGQRSDEAVE
ncbi:MAG: nitroreductase family protein [Sulfobacillus sp.]